jgi:hypothetical protein
VLPNNTYSAAATAESSHGLFVPTALEVIRGPLLAGQSLPARFRLQGLVTLLTVCALESRASFVSHRQRSWDSPFGDFLSHRHPRPFDREEPAYRWLGVLFRRTRRRTGPTSLGFQVHTCRDCLAITRFFKPAAAGASLGFCPSRVLPAKALPRISPGTPLARFVEPGSCPPEPLAPQSIDRLSPRLARPAPKC